MMDVRPAAIGVFGKVPWRAEYLKLRWDGEPFTSFDSWVTDNVEWAALHAGHAFHEASRGGEVNAFVYRPKNGQGVLAGAILASTDSAGRNFPLIVAAPLVAAGEIGASPEVLPLVLEDFWQQASELAVAVQRCGSVEHAASVAAADFSAGPGPAEARAAYAEWCGALPLADLFALVYGEGGISTAESAVRFVVDAVRPFRAVERPLEHHPTGRGIRERHRHLPRADEHRKRREGGMSLRVWHGSLLLVPVRTAHCSRALPAQTPSTLRPYSP